VSKLDVVIMNWKSEVEELEIALIERGVPPCEAHDKAVNMITSRRRQAYADQSGS